MINTRILEQRLGWGRHDPSQPADAPTPETRPIRHEPLLQGRIRPLPGMHRASPRRADTEALWQDLPIAAQSLDTIDARHGVLHSIDRNSAAAAALDQLRAQLMRLVRANNWRRIGVTSPRRGAGRSFIAAGLAASLSRLETLRVLLIDMDLGAPDLAKKLGLRPPGPLESLLGDETAPEEHLLRIGTNLALALNDTPIPRAADLVQDPAVVDAMRHLMELLAPDVAIFDLPPLLGDALSTSLLPQLDAVLLVADGTATQAQDITECERILEGQVPLLGVILNKSEDPDPRDRGAARV
ncbi:MAG: CpsD/CapB family tyrosine-protein kinase [Pararhodobacter sp.]